MINYDTIQQYASSAKAYASNLYEFTYNRVNHLEDNVWSIAKLVAKCVAVVFAYKCNPNTFWISFVIGAVWSQQVKAKLDQIYKSFETNYRKMFYYGALLTIVELPHAILPLSIWAGARIGSILTSSSDEMTQTASANATY